MRTFWIITLVLVTVLVMATAASASVRDEVAALVGAGSGDSSGDGGGTFTVKALQDGDQPETSDGWEVENAPAGDGDGTYTFRSNEDPVDPAVADPAGDEERWSEEMEPVGPSEEPPTETPVDAETATKKAKGQAEDAVAE